MSEDRFSGRCFCGAITFEVGGPVLYSCFCHCESCRRASGGAYVPWATFHRERFKLTRGQLRERHSSPGVTRGHCADCGTSLTYEHVDRAGQVDIAVVAFADPGAFDPVSHIWVEDQLGCVRLDDGLPRYTKTAGTAQA